MPTHSEDGAPSLRYGRPKYSSQGRGEFTLSVLLLGAGLVGCFLESGGARSWLQQLLSPVSCSSPAVTDIVKSLVMKAVPQDLLLTTMAQVDETTISIDAIRPRESVGSRQKCATVAHLRLLPKPGASARETQGLQAILQQQSEITVAYRAEPTDDGREVYVTMEQAE